MKKEKVALLLRLRKFLRLGKKVAGLEMTFEMTQYRKQYSELIVSFLLFQNGFDHFNTPEIL